MAVLPIRTIPDPCLSMVAQPVDHIDDSIGQVLDDMIETMYAHDGCGLAANQVGILKRLIVMDISSPSEPPAPKKLVNPEILWSSSEEESTEQGCLSVPNYYAAIKRPAQVRFRYLDEKGKTHEIETDGLLATCIQHEIDHLNGVLFIDHLSSLKKSMVLRKLLKDRKRKTPVL